MGVRDKVCEKCDLFAMYGNIDYHNGELMAPTLIYKHCKKHKDPTDIKLIDLGKYLHNLGYKIKIRRTMTKSKFLELMKELEKEFNEFYNTNDYSFELEKVVEGGIKFVNPRMKGYKSIRLNVFDKDGNQINNYPYVDDNWRTTWSSSNDLIIGCEKGYYIDPFLKAFDGAPFFTKNEVQIIRRVFCKYFN